MGTPWGTFSYTYDALNRLTSITNAQGELTTFAYDAAGRRVKMNLPNNTETDYTYDAAGELTQLVSHIVSSTTVIAFAKYTYDAAGDRTSMTDVWGVHTYTYDNLHRLTGATHPAGSGLKDLNETFSYDKVGNRLSDDRLTGYHYDAANELTYNSSFTYTYDNNGNQTSKSSGSWTTNYTYSSENRLLKTSLPNGITVKYQYDGQGRRIEKSTGTATSQSLQYIYDGQNIVAILDGGNNLIALFTNGPGIDQPLIMRRGSTDYFYHADGLGSIVALTNSSGQIVETYAYQAYGGPVIRGVLGNRLESSLVGNSFLFTAREYESNGGIYYYRMRYFDPNSGRFMRPDPSGFSGGDINLYSYADSVGKGSTSQYQYAFNAPTRYTDPLGLWSISADYYDVFGGGVTFGWNPPSSNRFGLPFIQVRVGAGFGGGVVWNPNAVGPIRQRNTDVHGRACWFGSASGNAGPVEAGVGAEQGGTYSIGQENQGYPFIQPFSGGGPYWGIGNSWGISGTVATGIQLTGY